VNAIRSYSTNDAHVLDAMATHDDYEDDATWKRVGDASHDRAVKDPPLWLDGRRENVRWH
jgi:hypothetical protein